MKPFVKYLLIAGLVAISIGACGTVAVVDSDSGYGGGMIFGFLFILFSALCFVTLLAGLITVTKPAGPALLLFTLLLPATFLGTASIAKYFELGAYREEPMRPIIPSVANKVIFKPDVTQDDAQKFWREVLSEPHEVSGTKSRPGIQAISTSLPENGLEVILFSFFPTATEGQKADVRERIENHPAVYQYLEGVDTTPPPTPTPPVAAGANQRLPSKVIINSSGTQQ